LSSTLRRIIDRLFGGGSRDRDAYRGCDPSERDANTRYADCLGDIVKAIANNTEDRGPEAQLADDLSGRYPPFTVSWKRNSESAFGFFGETSVLIKGQIFDNQGKCVGICRQKFYRDADGDLVAENDHLQLHEAAQRQGFATALYNELDDYYRRSGVDVIKVRAGSQAGGYLWALRDFDWDPDPGRLALSFGDVQDHLDELIFDSATHPDDQELLRQMRRRLDENDPGKGWPTPKELAELRGVDPKLGRTLMVGTNWYGIFPLSDRGKRRYGT
jgi:GNAT superfamily N-acetyltransferase